MLSLRYDGVWVDLELTQEAGGQVGAYEQFYEAMRDAVMGKGQVPVPAEEAANVIRVIELALLSQQSGCSKQQWTSPASR